MSKKMLKRSLALGALMAFVITGQAWAEVTYQTEIRAEDNDVTIAEAQNLTITSDGSGRLMGVMTINGKKLTVNDNFSITANIANGYTDMAGGVRNYVGETVFNGDSTNITVINEGNPSQVDIANAINDPKKGISSTTFNASETNLKYINQNEGTTTTEILGVFASSGDENATSINFTGNTATIDIDAGKNDNFVYGAFVWNKARITSTANNTLNIYVDAESNKEIAGIWVDKNGETGIVDLKGNLNAVVNNSGSERAYGIYAPNGGIITVAGTTSLNATSEDQSAYGVCAKDGADIDLADTTITATSKEGRAYGVWVDESTIDIADTTITATSENSRAVGIAAANSGNEVYVDGDITINATAGERADGMNLDKTTVNVTGKLTVDATGNVDSDSFGAQGVRLAYSTATFTDVDISAKSTTTGKVYGIRMLGDNDATNTQLAISGNADVYAETNGVAYGIVVSTGADLGLEDDDLSDTGKNLEVTVIGKEEASAIRAQYGSDINVSANTDVEIIATSENGNAYGVVNSCLTYDDANYAKANANISILGNVNIKANGKTGSYAVYNSTDRSKKDIEEVGDTVIGGEGKLVTITGDMYANSGSITTTFGAEGSQFDGKVETVNSGTTTLNFAKGAIWNLKGASTLTNATFDAGSTLVIEGNTFDAKEGSTDYALNGVGSDSKLTVKDGAKLTVTGIKETTYNIAKGFKTLEGTKVDETTTKYWDVNDVNTLMQGVLWNNGENGLQLEVYAKPADTLSEEMNVSESTAQSIANVTTAAQAAEKKGAKPDANGIGDDKALALVVAMSGADSKVAGQAFEAVSKMAEAGGNSGTAASIVKNVTGVTNDRLSFNCGHSAPHKGGHGVGLFEEGSGADIWVEYVHGKDKVEDMPSTAGASSYEGQYNGIVMGVDFKKVNKFQSGLAFNYGEGDTNSVGSAARTHSDYDFWGIGYYGSIHNDDSNVIFDIGYAKTDSDVETNTIGINYKASPETTTWTAGVKLEKLYQNENVQIVPYTGLRFMSIDPEDYSTECASSKYDMERQNVWLLPLGVSIRQEIANDNGWTVSPRVDLSYIWAFGDTDSEMEFSTLGTKTNIGYEVMDDGSVLGLVGIEAHKGQWGFGVSYSYQKGDHSESKKWFIDANYSF